MWKDQIKLEINKVLDHFSDEGLEKVLNLLKKLDSKSITFNFDILQKILKAGDVGAKPIL